MKYVCLVLASVVVGILGVRFFLKTNTLPSIDSSVSQVLAPQTPTPLPFSELTIPYLRNRPFTSSLGQQKQVYEKSNYTAYTTSYISDNLTINGLLTKPKGQMPKEGWPAVVFVHGYIPPAQYKTLGNYVEYVDYLARNGFVVFKIDLRGHDDSEGIAGGGYYSADYVIDTLNAIAALTSSDFVNSKAIGLWGHSMAGNVTLRSMAVKTDIPALVIWAGAVYTYIDQQHYGINDNSFQPNRNPSVISKRRELLEKVGSPSATSAFWNAMAPTNFLSDIQGAIEVHHARDDSVVNIGYSRELMALFDKTSVPHELFEYPTGGHNITGQSFSSAMTRTVKFYQAHLR